MPKHGLKRDKQFNIIRSDYLNQKDSNSTSCFTNVVHDGFGSSKSIKRLNDDMLDSYQVFDKYDSRTYQRAEKHSKKVNTYLQKIKDDIVKAHIKSIKQENLKNDMQKLGFDVNTIPERASDDPFGLIDKLESIQENTTTVPVEGVTEGKKGQF